MNLAHAFHGLVWLAAFIWMSGSIERTIRCVPRWHDGTWAIVWFLALVQLGYTVRWVMGFAPDHMAGMDTSSAAGLLVFSGLGAIAFMRRRFLIDGARW